jgi:hypothetical protein
VATTRTEDGHKQWLQHVQRMDTNRIPKQTLQYKPKGLRNIGRPRKRWRDQFHFEDQGTGNTPNPLWTVWWWWLWCICNKGLHFTAAPGCIFVLLLHLFLPENVFFNWCVQWCQTPREFQDIHKILLLWLLSLSLLTSFSVLLFTLCSSDI